jgi:fatty-acyl-CoA synthase
MKWSIGKIASKRAALTPNNLAIIFEDKPITYRELNQEVNRVANFFIEKGLKKGDRIAVDLLNCPEFIACYLAAAKLGLIFVPLNFRMVSREITYQLNQCNCRLIVFHDEFTQYIESARDGVSVETDKYIFLSTAPSSEIKCPPWAIPYSEAVSSSSCKEPDIPEPIDLDDPFVILYTSGVTGNPKGAVITHAQTYFKCFQIINYTDMRRSDIFQSQAPLCHSAGLCAVATPTLCRGATLLMRYNFDSKLFVCDIERYRATIVFGLTTMFRFILETGVIEEIDLSSVRVYFGGGEKTSHGMLQALSDKGISLQIGFGQTENSAMVLMPEDAVGKKPGSVGLPNFFSELWIENEKGERLPPGEIGEIVAVGPNVMKEYWNMPEATTNTIVNGVLHTGDLGYMDEDGFVYMVDRAKDMYRSGAENVFPAEVENVLADHPDITAVAVIGVPDKKWGETGKAYIVTREGKSLSLSEIHQFLSGKIARYKFPALIEIVESLPTTVWGKVQKAKLKEMHKKNNPNSLG